MTKVKIGFGLQRPLDEEMLERISDAHSIYGIQRIKVDPSLNGLSVEYDATRLRPAEVQATLEQAGLPVIAVK